MPVKKNITYKDLDGNPVTEEYYFNLSKPEVAEMEVEHEGGLSSLLLSLDGTANGAQIMDVFKKLLTKAVGLRSANGRYIEKTDEIRKEFFQSAAYDELFTELITDAKFAAEFTKNIMPEGLEALAEKVGQNAETGKDDDPRPAWEKENREPNGVELTTMSREQLVKVMQQREAKKIRAEIQTEQS